MVLKKLLLSAILSVSVFCVPAVAAQSLYESVTNEVLAKGIDYKFKNRLTKEGWLDIHVLTADLSNENIEIAPIISKKEIGLRETTDKLVLDNSAVAGVNSAYFGMTGKYSSSFGPEVANGNIMSLDTDKNIDSNQFGTYFVDKNGNALFDYYKTTMLFNVEGKDFFELTGINKITQMVYPLYIDKNIGENTAAIDARFEGLVKLKVENDHITYISQKGETVNIPENGYVIVLSSEYADAYVQYLAVGQSAKINMSSSLDLNNIKTAISGGGVILKNGVKPESIGEMAAGRQPRTLLGLSQDQKTLKLIVVDGKRSNGNNKSIGANVDEAIQILIEEGCYYGINLDGGGSSTMAVKDPLTKSVNIVSSPAEGVARAVMTAVGVFDNSAVGEVSSLNVVPSSNVAIAGGQVTFNVEGYDDNMHRIYVPIEQVTFSSDDNSGYFNGNVYTYGAAEKAKITVFYNGITVESDISIDDINSISAEVSDISLDVGESVSINVIANTYSGESININNMAKLNASFGSINNNVYTATEKGEGYIECSYGQNTCYVKVSVGTEEKAIDSFENVEYLDFSSYPSTIKGIAGLSQKYVSDGQNALGLSYYFDNSNETQAAYLNFVKPAPIEGKPKKLKLDVYGNKTGHWVRAKISDSNGNESVIDFSRDVSWEGWQTLTADIPNVSYPITLKTIYVAAISNSDTEQKVMYFDNLRGIYPVESNIEVPRNVSASDADFNSKQQGYYYVNIAGAVSSGNVNDTALYDKERKTVHGILQTNADISVYAGKSDISFGDSTEVIRWNDGYSVYYKDNVTFVNMTAKNGGFKSTYDEQWQRFENDILMSPNKFVVILTDVSPSNFDDEREGELFKSALKYIEDLEREVIVVSASSTAYWSSVKDGIQYINLPSMWLQNGSINKDFRILKLRFGNDKMSYQVNKVY